jgi:hypothetical protein
MKKAFSVLGVIQLLLLIIVSLVMSAFNFNSVIAENEWCEIGVEYRAVDGLTVILHSFNIIEKTGSYQYTILYTLRNDNPDQKILEGAFKLYYRDESGGLPQYGFFDYLFPGDSKTRSYTFEELKSKLFDVLEYHHDNFFSNEPLPDSLKWKVIYPDTTPPSTEHDYDGTWRNSNFRITLTATDNINKIDDIFYKINDGPVKRVSMDGHPLITSEGANNSLEYWSIDWAGNEELPHKMLNGIKLDKTSPSIGTPSRIPEGDVEPNQKVKILVNATDFLSGIQNVILSYNLNTSTIWTDLPMTFNSTIGLYEATIQVQQANTLVRYKFVAYDNAGNYIVDDNGGQYYVYTVIPEFSSNIILALFITTILMAVALLRAKRKHEHSSFSVNRC